MSKFDYGQCQVICNEAEIFPAMKQLVEEEGMSVWKAAKFIEADSGKKVTAGRAEQVYIRRAPSTRVESPVTTSSDKENEENQIIKRAKDGTLRGGQREGAGRPPKYKEPTFEDQVAKIAREERKRKKEEQKKKQREAHKEIPLPSDKYRILYADPPWKYSDELIEGYGAATHHYPQMTVAELCDLPIKDLSEENAVLFLWVTSPLLSECWPIITSQR